MIVKQKATGFHVWNDYMDGAPGLGLDSDRVDQCVAYYHEQGYRGLFGSPSFGFHHDDLDFLARMTTAKWLWFWDVSLRNVDAIYELTALEHMGVNPKRPGIDFRRFATLGEA